MNVGVGVLARIAEPVYINAGGQQCRRHASLRVKVVFIPPIVAVIEHDGDVDASVLRIDHGFHKVNLMEQVHVNVQRVRGAVDPSKQVSQTVFGCDERCDGAALNHVRVEAEGAATQSAPLFVPVSHRVGVRCVTATASTEVDQVVKVRNRFGQRNARPTGDLHRAVAVDQRVGLFACTVQELQGSTRIREVECTVQNIAEVHHGAVLVDAECISIVGEDHGFSGLNHQGGDGGVVAGTARGGSEGPAVEDRQFVALVGEFDEFHVR